MIASRSVKTVRHPRGSHVVIPMSLEWPHQEILTKYLIGATIPKQEGRHKMPKSVSRKVLERMQFTLHATPRSPYGTWRLVQAMSAWLVETRRASSRHCRDASVYGQTTTAMHKLSTPPSAPPRPPPHVSCACAVWI